MVRGQKGVYENDGGHLGKDSQSEQSSPRERKLSFYTLAFKYK